MRRLLAPALVAMAPLLQGACGQPRPPEAHKVLTIPPAPRDTVSAVDLVPALRFVRHLDDRSSESRFLRDAGLIYRCGENYLRGVCALRGGGELVQQPRFELMAKPEPAEVIHEPILSFSGPWPDRAWMAERLGDVYSNSVWYSVYVWTNAGWANAITFDHREGYRYVGAGEWTGGRIITPYIGINWRPGKDPNGPVELYLVEKPRFRVLSGPPASDLPLLADDVKLYPRAFASLASGHAFLAYERGDHSDLVVHRWAPGDRRPTQDEIPGVRTRFTFHDMSHESWWEGDRAREILAVAPDEVYVVGEVYELDAETRIPVDSKLAIAQFDGRGWRVSFIPTERRFVAFARGPDRSLWVTFSNDLYGEHPEGELWRRPPGGELQRVALPPVVVDDVTVELSPFDVWPRGADEVWLIGRSGRRDSREEPIDRKKYPYGLFLLKPSLLAAEPR